MANPFHQKLDPKKKTASKTFVAPTKEQATTGRFMNPGDDYGVGYRAPVGNFRASGLSSGPIPQEVACMDPNMVNFKD